MQFFKLFNRSPVGIRPVGGPVAPPARMPIARPAGVAQPIGISTTYSTGPVGFHHISNGLPSSDPQFLNVPNFVHVRE